MEKQMTFWKTVWANVVANFIILGMMTIFYVLAAAAIIVEHHDKLKSLQGWPKI